MIHPVKNPENWKKPDRILYLTARGVALVAGIFISILCILIITNYLQIKRTDPLNTNSIEQLLVQLQNNPHNESLKEQIRELDLLARRAFFTSKEFSHSGAYLLLGGVVILLIALKIVMIYKKQLPYPSEDNEENKDRSNILSLYAIGTLGGVIIITSLLLTTLFRPDFDISDLKLPKILQNFPKSPADEVLIKQWPNFRGPKGIAVSYYTNIPIHWDGKSGENISWKSEIPLPGYSSPIVWETFVFLTGGNKKKREIYCYDAKDGKILWRKILKHIPGSPQKPPKVTDDTGYAAPTMATDGRLVFALFATGDLICLDFDGVVIWSRNLGVPDNPYGHASSLILYNDFLLIQYDHAEKCRFIACDVKTGRNIWEKDRDVSTSWASPILIDGDFKKEIILNATPYVISYNPETGDELWKLKCMSGEVAPSPAYADGMIFVVNRYARLVAIKRDDNPKILWDARGDLPDVSSPLATGKYVFIASSEGVVTCFDQQKGNVLWKNEFDTGFYSSPILVDDKIYLLDKEGNMRIFKSDSKYIQVGNPKLGEGSLCTPAFCDGRIYIRGSKYLYCIGGYNEHP